MADLQGKVIATFEARRAKEMADLIARHGGVPYAAPALREVPLENAAEVQTFIERVIATPPDIYICLTGVGTRALLERAASFGRQQALLEAWARTIVVARGPKPVAVLRQHNVRIDLVPPEPNTSRELQEMLRPLRLRGKRVAIQHYGETNEFLRSALKDEGAEIWEVSLYRWEMPEDQGPLRRFLSDVQEGRIDVVAATSKSQVRNLFALAEHFDQGESLRAALGRLVVAAVGPVTAEEWRAFGVQVDVEPEHPHMGHLVVAIGEHLAARRSSEFRVLGSG